MPSGSVALAAFLAAAPFGAVVDDAPAVGAPPPAPAVDAFARPVVGSPERPDAKRVLVLGDSHATTSFGRALDLLLRSLDDVEVTTIGGCGVSPDAFVVGGEARCGFLRIEHDASTPDWVVVAKKKSPTPRVDELLSRARPDLTIVELGANQIHTAWVDPARAKADVVALADAVRASGSACLWVGPPTGHARVKPHERIDRVYTVLEEALAGRCTLLDSRPSAMPFLDYERVAPKRGDGRHFDRIGPEGQALAGRWALEVFKVARRMLDARATVAATTSSTPPVVASP